MAGDSALPEDKWLAEELRSIHAAIDELRGARAINATTMVGGTFELREETGTRKMLRFGSFGNADDGTLQYGIVMYDDISANVLDVLDNERGLVFPHDPRSWIVPTGQSVAAASSWVNVAETKVIFPNADVLVAEAAVICPVGSTAEVRIRDLVYGDVTSVVTVPDGGNGTVTFEWEHPFSIGWGDVRTKNSPFLHWEVRVASGPGPVTAFPPRHLTFRNKRFAPARSTTGGGRFG